MSKSFKVKDWLPDQKLVQPSITKPTTEIRHQFDYLMTKILDQKLDLTQGYSNWLKIGFALANEFDEAGRDYYHQISQFHPEYDWLKCNEQFNKCLNKNKGLTNLATIYYLFKTQNNV